MLICKDLTKSFDKELFSNFNLELKHGEIVKYLKSEYSLTHGYTNLIARKNLANN